MRAQDVAVPRCVRAVARTEISVLIGAPFPLCLASLDRLSKLSTAAREQARAWSPPRVLSARAEKATLQHSVHARRSWHGCGCASPSRLCQLFVADAGLVWEGLLQVMAIEE